MSSAARRAESTTLAGKRHGELVPTRTITLPPGLETAVTDRVANGSFESETDVIREALKLLSEREHSADALRRRVARGIEDSDAGRVSLLSADDIKRMARERFHR